LPTLSAMPKTRTLARWTLVATVALIALGGYTRGSGSGYGCEDRWPLCENGLLGGLLPRLDFHMIVEWTHRWVAAGIGVLILATAISAWHYRPRSLRAFVPAVVAVAALFVEAWLGRMVVKGDLAADLVSLHLTVSVVIVGCLALVMVATEPDVPRAAGDIAWAWWLGVGAAVAYAVLLLGSLVHNLYVPGWPLVGDRLVPNLSNSDVATHWIHRLAAAAGWVYLVILALAGRRRARTERATVLIALAAFTVTVGLGAAHVFTKVTSGGIVAAHLLFSTIVWAALVVATARTSGYAAAPDS